MDDPGQRYEDNIQVQVDEPFENEIDAFDLVQAIRAALEAEERAAAEVTLVVTDDDAVAALNQRYRDIEGPTDVLSFGAQEPTEGFVAAPGADQYLGDIIIALPFTRCQASNLGHALESELRLLAVHGVLHLLGYDHAAPAQEKAMWARQEAILASLPPLPRTDGQSASGAQLLP